jgi:hypothetical protein
VSWQEDRRNASLCSALHEEVARIATQPLKGEGNKNERRDKLKEVIYQRFDFTEIAKLSLGGSDFSDPALDSNAWSQYRLSKQRKLFCARHKTIELASINTVLLGELIELGIFLPLNGQVAPVHFQCGMNFAPFVARPEGAIIPHTGTYCSSITFWR